MVLGSQEELREQIINAGLERACLQLPFPKNPDDFNVRCDEGKARLNLLVQDIARLVLEILLEYQLVNKKIQSIKAHKDVVTDIQSQLQALITKDFILCNPYSQLIHFARYLKSISVRIERLKADPERDSRLSKEWASASFPWARAIKLKDIYNDPAMANYRWLLEELRVSLFAQELRTPMPVSVKRLQKIWDGMRR